MKTNENITIKSSAKKFYTNKFIVIEGLDCSGKSTQVAILNRIFQDSGIKCVATKEPGGTEYGESVRSILLSNASKELSPMTRLLAFLSIRAEHYTKVLIPKMEAGYTIICDRFTLSTYAYLHSKLDLMTIATVEEASIGSLCNALEAERFKNNVKYIFLDVPSTVFKKRYELRKKSSLNYFDKYVFQNFHIMRKAYQELAPELGYETIDADADEALVTKRILSAIRENT